MDQKKKIIIAAAGAVALVVVLIFVLLPGDKNRDGGREKRDIFSEPGSDEVFSDTPKGRLASYKRILKEYQEWSVYPPNSRPLLKEHEDLIEYTVIKTHPQALLYIDPIDKKAVKSAYQCLLQPLKHTVVGGESQLVTLWCNRAPDGSFVPIQITDVFLEKHTPSGNQRQPTPNLNDKGQDGDVKAGDNVHTMTWKPGQSDWGEMDLTIKLKVPEEKENREYELSTGFFSSPRLIAEYTGQIRDKIVDGSLVVSAEINVMVPGYYELAANLFNTEEEPVGITRMKVDLKGGKQWVDFLFFGKIIRDRGISGPYVLTALRGERKNLPLLPTELAGKSPQEAERIMQASLNRPEATQPNREVMPASDKKLKTSAYKVSDFSDRPYDGPDKKERIQMYEEQIRDAEAEVR